MQNKKFGALSSSTNPQELSATVSGAILSFSALIIFVAGHFGFNIDNAQLTDLAGQIGLAAGALWFIFGVVRKVVVAIQQKWQVYKS